MDLGENFKMRFAIYHDVILPSNFLVLLIASLVLLQADLISAQGCSNQCPPINAGQGEVMALCEGDQIGTFANVDKIYNICHPVSTSSGITSFALKDFIKPNHITVVANYYTGCNAGRRESGVFAHIAQRFPPLLIQVFDREIEL